MSSHAHSSASPRFTNRLALETSPYLLQHQHNPVDWYPWGPEAFARARREDKPIFLSVGYSTCYWCHVMERQSFESEAVAAVMNELFVNIKVDREERPDVDQLYMTGVQVLTRHGGWPMSVWLTPDLRPFYGGTYYPPTDQYGRPGFVSLLRMLADAYRTRRADVEQTADELAGILRQLAEPDAPDRPTRIDDAFVADLVQRSSADYDAVHGGFGGAPKFPRETLLELLLVYASDLAAPRRDEVRRRVLHTLDALAAGGIRDHLGGGFHRYSTDAKWLVPHFEVMLYDNAMLAWCYVEAFRQTKDPRYADVARGVLDFVRREMTSPEGAFYTAFDAEVDGQEGLNYLWTPAEVEAVLGADDARVFNRVYGLDRGPNFADPHHGSGVPDRNILFHEITLDREVVNPLAAMREKLKAARDLRKQPLLDTKVLTSWNALMIRALAHGGQVLNEPTYVAAASEAMQFLLTRHRKPDGLYRTSRDGVAKYDGYLDDYAAVAQAMVALAHAGAPGGNWLRQAADIMRAVIDRFGAGAGGFYFTDRGATDLIVRQRTATDSPLPSGNAMAAQALLALGETEATRATLAAFAQPLRHNGDAMSSMVQAALLYLRQGGEAFTVPARDEAGKSVQRPPTPEQAAEDAVRIGGDWVSPTELHVRLAIAPGFHVNGHEPPTGDVPLIPTRLSIDAAPPGVAVEYPAPVGRDFSFAEHPLFVYEGDLTIVVRFATPPTSGLRLSLAYQACDASTCLPSVTRRMDVSPP